MKNQTRPFTVVLLAPIAEQPIHALVAIVTGKQIGRAHV